jgi:hypothetical protein
MGGEEFQPFFTSEDRFAELVEEFDKSQATLLEAIPNCIEDNKHGYQRARSGEAAKQAAEVFLSTTTTIISDPELTKEQQIAFITTLYHGVKGPRRELFASLAPSGDFDADPETSNDVAESLNDYFDSKMSLEAIAQELTSSYACNYEEDLEELFGSLDFTFNEKVRLLAIHVGHHALEVGKLSAGIAIGGIIAGKVLQKNRR